MPPYSIMHALLFQWIRPVIRLAATKSNLIYKTFFFCIKMRPYIVHKQKHFSDHLYIGSPSLFTCVDRLLCKFWQPVQNNPELSLDGFISHLLQALTTLLKREKYQLLHSHLPRSPEPAWQLASLLPLQLGPDITLPLNSPVQEFSAGFALSQPLASCQSILLSSECFVHQREPQTVWSSGSNSAWSTL